MGGVTGWVTNNGGGLLINGGALIPQQTMYNNSKGRGHNMTIMGFRCFNDKKISYTSQKTTEN